MRRRTVHVLISGQVQGVFFRSTLNRVAIENKITGWVRNLPDGKVEALFQGSEDRLEKVIQWCHKGPTLARVDSVEVSMMKENQEFRNFAIIC